MMESGQGWFHGSNRFVGFSVASSDVNVHVFGIDIPSDEVWCMTGTISYGGYLLVQSHSINIKVNTPEKKI